MFLNKNKNGYGWHSTVKTKDGESEVVAYINFSFKKGTEPTPQQLSEYGSYEGELIFRDSTGAERKVFPIAKEWNDRRSVEFKLLETTNEYRDPKPTWQPKTDPKWDLSKEYTPRLDGKPDEEYWKLTASNISQDDLPFDE